MFCESECFVMVAIGVGTTSASFSFISRRLSLKRKHTKATVKMVKEFRLFITRPPLGIFVSDIAGRVLVVTEEAKQGYKCIQVTLRGYRRTYAGVRRVVVVRLEIQSPTTLTRTSSTRPLSSGAERTRLTTSSRQGTTSFLLLFRCSLAFGPSHGHLRVQLDTFATRLKLQSSKRVPSNGTQGSPQGYLLHH